MKHTSPQFGNYEFAFGRVNVVLGANGSGKSKFLSELRDAVPHILQGSKPVYIEGGRTIKIADVIKPTAANFSQYDALDSAISQYEQKRHISLANRLFDALVVLEKRELQQKSNHSDLAENWAEKKYGNYPKRPDTPFARLFRLFSEIFPQITISYDFPARRFSAQKNGATYGPSHLSDGEKQVFSILADMIDLGDSHTVIIADEPELNLHPELAERLWTLLESEFPEKTFVYASHSIGFAIRSSVDKVFVLSSNSENISELDGLDSLPRAELSAFLGALPGILSANRVLVTEGHEKSFDAIFYRWLLDDPRLEVYPAGGCSDVIAVATKSGLWKRIASPVVLCGVVDADYRDETYLAQQRPKGVAVLAVHEAESYLCIPEVASAVAKQIGSQEHPLAAEEVSDMILRFLRGQRLAIAARRVLAGAHIHLSVGVERKVLASTSSREDLIKELQSAAEEEARKADFVIGIDSLVGVLDRELEAIDRVLTNRNALEALRLIPGKEMLRIIAPRAGCKNGTDMMRSVSRHHKPISFPMLMELKTLLEQYSGRNRDVRCPDTSAAIEESE